MIEKFRNSAGIATLSALIALTAPAFAQLVPQADVQKIDALVNDEVISAYDVNQRINLLAAVTGTQYSEQELPRLREQVRRNIVDEKLQLQEAREFEVEVSENELSQAFVRVASNFNMNPEQFQQFLDQNGSGQDAIVHQIRAQIAWDSVVNGRLRPQISVGDEEVEILIERMESRAGEFEYRLSEIVLIVPNPSQEAVQRDTATLIVERIKAGVPFAALAEQFSQSSTAAVGGDMGWLGEDQLTPTLASRVTSLDVGGVSDPVRTPGGFHILSMQDRRRIMSLDPLDMQLDLQQLVFLFDESTTQEVANEVAERWNGEALSINSCETLPETAERIGASNHSNIGLLKLRDLPLQLRPTLEALEVGQAAKPVASNDGIRIIVLCGRQEPEIQKPDFDQIMNQLESQRLSMMSRRYLRDLRRDAIVDYR